MLKNDYIFPALFTYDSDGITVEFPDLPGAITAGNTEEEALSMAKECLELHLYGIEEDKEVIPNPSHIIEINHNKNQAIVLIKANMRATRDEMNNRTVKKTLTIPKWLNDQAMNKKINFVLLHPLIIQDDMNYSTQLHTVVYF